MAKCSKCNTSFEGRPEKCPGCGAKFNWGALPSVSASNSVTETPASSNTVASAATDKKDVKLESSSFLEKYVYVIRTLNFLPVVGWVNTAVVGLKFKDYKTSLKENRRHAYKKFLKSGIFWGIIWLVIAIITIVMFKSIATDPSTYSGI